MIITRPFAALVMSHGRTQDTYYIRFNAACGKMFDGARYCFISRTEDMGYLIIRVSKTQTTRTKHTSVISRDKSGGTKLACARLVNSGFLPERIFGKRYKVKKDKDGNLYVCLREPLDDDEQADRREGGANDR